MQIEIQIYGFLENCVPKRFRGCNTKFEFESPITVYHLMVADLKIISLDATVIINGKMASAAQVINDRDNVRIFSPIAGG